MSKDDHGFIASLARYRTTNILAEMERYAHDRLLAAESDDSDAHYDGSDLQSMIDHMREWFAAREAK